MEKFSPTKLDTYRHCPLQYKFKYVDRLKAERAGVEAAVGTCVHEAFEELYQARAHGKLLSEEEVLRVFELAWSKAIEDPPTIRDKRFSLEDWKRVGEECVRGYYRAYAPFDQDKTVAVEKRVGFSLPVVDPASGETVDCRVEGFVDRLALGPDGCFEIHDYKTGASLPTQAQKDEDWQLALYDIAVREAWPDAPGVRLVWHYVRHGKNLVSTRTPEQLEALKGQVRELIGRIEDDHTFAPMRSPLCDWCDYRDLCPLFRHPEDYARLPKEERKEEPGGKLVDDYAKLEVEKKALSDRLKEIEGDIAGVAQRLIAYMRAHGILVVAGADHQAEMHVREELKFPTRTAAPKKVEQMEAELRGTPAWSVVSRLDTRTLLDAFHTHKLPAAAVDLVKTWIARWGRQETHETVRLHKTREARDE